MEKLKAWWAKSRWAVWVALGVIVAILALVLRGMLSGGKSIPGGGRLPVPKAIQDQVDRAEEDGLRARVQATAKADSQKEQLNEVMKLDDGAERRKRLAEMLSKT